MGCQFWRLFRYGILSTDVVKLIQTKKLRYKGGDAREQAKCTQ